MQSFDQDNLCEVTRGNLTESMHRGHIAVVDNKGKLIACAGNPRHYGYMRSTAKLLQAIPLLEARGDEQFGLTEAETALCCSSHGGEPEHTAAVQSILHKLGLTESALACGRQEPLYKPSADELKQKALQPSQLHNTCSGKHAGMLVLAKAMNVSIKQYTRLEHPVQQKKCCTSSHSCAAYQQRISVSAPMAAACPYLQCRCLHSPMHTPVWAPLTSLQPSAPRRAVRSSMSSADILTM